MNGCFGIKVVNTKLYLYFKMVDIEYILKKHSTAIYTLREESSQTNVILLYKLLAAILSKVCSVIQKS